MQREQMGYHRMRATDIRQQLEHGLKQLQLELQSHQIEQLFQLLILLEKWNKTYNLTAIRQPADMLTLHILDSLAVWPHITGQCTLDVGTGPGFPGLPLAIVLPNHQFTLLDSNAKKTRFIQMAIAQLNLQNVSVTQHRVENFKPTHLFDNIVSRAFTQLDKMTEWTQHLLAPTGSLLAMKGQYPTEELRTLDDTHWRANTIELKVPALDAQRHLVKLVQSV